jgi:ubiquinone biosynthesis monooxygenase Coq7
VLSFIDRVIVEVDRGLRAVAGEPRSARTNPADAVPEAQLSEAERRHVVGLMRVNHCGEVCAQALYQGQALGSRNPALRAELASAAREEEDHLAWTRQRITELGGRTSLLNPVWYVGSLAMGLAAGRLGDRWNLGFLAETEAQVERHLEGHLQRLSPQDVRTRAVVDAMRQDEAGHGDTARRLGAEPLPLPVQNLMRAAARVMTTTAYWV